MYYSVVMLLFTWGFLFHVYRLIEHHQQRQWVMYIALVTLFICVCLQEKVPNYVGFANLPNQVFRKAVKRGFQFTLMVVGKVAMWL